MDSRPPFCVAGVISRETEAIQCPCTKSITSLKSVKKKRENSEKRTQMRNYVRGRM